MTYREIFEADIEAKTGSKPEPMTFSNICKNVNEGKMNGFEAYECLEEILSYVDLDINYGYEENLPENSEKFKEWENSEETKKNLELSDNCHKLQWHIQKSFLDKILANTELKDIEQPAYIIGEKFTPSKSFENLITRLFIYAKDKNAKKDEATIEFEKEQVKKNISYMLDMLKILNDKL